MCNMLDEHTPSVGLLNLISLVVIRLTPSIEKEIYSGYYEYTRQIRRKYKAAHTNNHHNSLQ